jgi:hypothetical protein
MCLHPRSPRPRFHGYISVLVSLKAPTAEAGLFTAEKLAWFSLSISATTGHYCKSLHVHTATSLFPRVVIISFSKQWLLDVCGARSPIQLFPSETGMFPGLRLPQPASYSHKHFRHSQNLTHPAPNLPCVPDVGEWNHQTPVPPYWNPWVVWDPPYTPPHPTLSLGALGPIS